MVQVRESWYRHALRQVGLECLWLDVVAEQPVVQVAGHGGIVHGEGLEGVLHAVVASGLPDELRDVTLGDLRRHVAVAHLQRDVSLVDAHHVTRALPRTAVQPRRPRIQTQPQLIARHQSQLTLVPTRELEDSNSLVAQGAVPAHHEVLLLLVLLQLAVVLCLQLHQRSQNVLIVVSILIHQLCRLCLFVSSTCLSLDVFQCGCRVISPHFLQRIDLGSGNLSSPQLLFLRRNCHQPRQKRSIFYDRHPRGQVPIHVLQCSI
mmetsp:Transcript_5605/g.9206  ORF Transcript_5605/g.9206 Transcript_5605/m.9206 type:complete len:262 (+) Transcript_5605:2058-2843(+)